MSIRTDVFSIDWDASPRVIWIDIAFTEVSAQDLYDTCKHLEALHSGTDEPQICDAGGWEPIGPGQYVGITVSLFNAVYAFEARPGPAWVICNMAGGNVVAFTDKTMAVELYPRLPTAYVSADRTASSSATTQELEAIEYASFNNKITVDVINGVSGTGYSEGIPIGSCRKPSNNIPDAVLIANSRGFCRLYIIGNITLGVGHNVDGFEIYGQSATKSTFVIEDAASVIGCVFFDATISGTLDGNAALERCVINDLNYIEGRIYLCTLMGTIILSGITPTRIYNCYDGIPGEGMPIIDMGGSGRGLSLANYSGGIEIKNKTGSEEIAININNGEIVLHNTVTNGDIYVKGIGTLKDNSTGSAVVYDGMLSQACIADAVWDKILP